MAAAKSLDLNKDSMIQTLCGTSLTDHLSKFSRLRTLFNVRLPRSLSDPRQNPGSASQVLNLHHSEVPKTSKPAADTDHSLVRWSSEQILAQFTGTGTGATVKSYTENK